MKKDIKAIQKKLGFNGNTNQTALNQSKKAKTLDDSYELLFNLVEELRPIQEELEIGGHPFLTILHRNKEDLIEISFGISLGEIYHLLLYLEDDISIIQKNLILSVILIKK